MVQALYEKYRVDFEMFEYGISEYMKYASDSDGFMPDTINVGKTDNDKDDDQVISEPSTVNPWFRILNLSLPLNLIFSIIPTYCDISDIIASFKSAVNVQVWNKD